MRKCQKNCPINKDGKCLSGNAHKKDFGQDCKEHTKLLKYYGLIEKKAV